MEHWGARGIPLVGLIMFVGLGYAQGIECVPSANHSDQAVCLSPSLRKLDQRMVELLHSRATSAEISQTQTSWTVGKARCNGNIPCIDQAYHERISYLTSQPAMVVERAAASAVTSPSLTSSAEVPDSDNAVSGEPSTEVSAVAQSNGMTGSDTGTSDQQPESATGGVGSKGDPDEGVGVWTWLIMALLIIVVPMAIWHGITELFGRCPSCHKWGTRKMYDRDEQNYTDFRVVDRESVKRDNYGNVISRTKTPTQESFHVTDYTNHFFCTSCKYKWSRSGKTKH